MIRQEVIHALKKAGFTKDKFQHCQKSILYRIDKDINGDRLKQMIEVSDDPKYWDRVDAEGFMGIVSAAKIRTYKTKDYPGGVSEWVVYPCSIVTTSQLNDIVFGILDS